MRFIYRWIANGFAFYLGLYLIDTVIAPFHFIKKGWIAIVLAVLLSCVNSTIRPFPKFKANKGRAFGFVGLTALGNFVFLQVIAWLGAPLDANPFRLAFAAIFLTLLAALMNHIVGFKPKEQPDVIAREHRLSDATRERLAQPSSRKPTRRRRSRG